MTVVYINQQRHPDSPACHLCSACLLFPLCHRSCLGILSLFSNARQTSMYRCTTTAELSNSSSTKFLVSLLPGQGRVEGSMRSHHHSCLSGCKVTVFLSSQIQGLLPQKWYDVQRECQYIGQTGFASVSDMIDEATGTPTVALVSPLYKTGNILDQKNTTKEQKRNWVSSHCFLNSHNTKPKTPTVVFR